MPAVTKGGVLETSDNNQQGSEGRREGEQGGSVCFSAGVRWENSASFEGGEEGISQDRQRVKLEKYRCQVRQS